MITIKKFDLAKLLIFALITGAFVAYIVNKAIDPKATSEESHVVYNYITSFNINASPAIMARFIESNNNWPPSKKDLAIIMLDASINKQEK